MQKKGNDIPEISDSESQPVVDLNETETNGDETPTDTSDTPTLPATEPSEDIIHPSEAFDMTDQRCLGIWEAEAEDVQLVIYDISPDSMQFVLIIDNVWNGRAMTITATAIEEDGKFLFGDGVSIYYRGTAELTGSFEFKNDSIKLMYDSLGLVPDYVKAREVDCEFYKKSDISDWDIAGYKAGHPDCTSKCIIREDFEIEMVK